MKNQKIEKISRNSSRPFRKGLSSFFRLNFATSVLILFLGLSLGFVNPHPALAVPSLGVATGGTYYSQTGTTLTAYQQYFTNSLVTTGTNGLEGFGILPSGNTLDVFSNVAGEDIYLLTNANVESANNPTFDGQAFTKFNYGSGTIPASYNPTPYYGVDLGQVGSSPWTTLPKPPFSPNPPQYYLDAGTLDYNGTIGTGNYFFVVSVVPIAGSNQLDVTAFSPATTSAVGIPSTPENSTLIMMGSGLMLLGLITMRRRFVLPAPTSIVSKN